MYSRTGAITVLILTAFLQPFILAAAPMGLPPISQRVGDLSQPVLDLQGTWRFNERPLPQFWENVSDTCGWRPIAVPGEWVMQGFQVPINRYAGYQRTFTLPASWRNQCVILHCNGVYSDARVYVNGQFAGQHLGGFTPFEMDITPLVRQDDENRLCLQVKNESLADTLASATAYAAHPLGGITRSMYLLARPALYCESLIATTTFDSIFRNATLQLQLHSRNRSQRSKRVSVRFELIDPRHRPVPASPFVFDLGTIAPDSGRRHTFDLKVPEAMTWDSEHPRLYTLLCTLLYDGQEQQTIRQRIGLRQIEIRGQQLFVNGKPIKLRGVNRHEVHPLLGRSLTPSLWRQDAELYRAANINYIRTSHYPPAEEFITACDSLGLFVEEEAPLVWIGHGANPRWQTHDPHDSANYPLMAQAITEMIERDRNHPCVLLWSLANESEWGPLWQRLLALADRLDSSRPKTFHDQAWGRYNNHGSTALSIANYHYPAMDGLDSVAHRGRPVLFGEYCHLNCYNRREIVTDPGIRDEYGRALLPMWEKIMATPGCLGGAIWSGIDDIFQLPDGREVGYGSWGPLDGWRRLKPEYWHIKMAYAPVKVLDSVLTCTPPYRLRILNRHNFTDLDELDIHWRVLDQEGRLRGQAAPFQTAKVTIPFPDPVPAGTLLAMQFVNASGTVVQSVRIPMGAKSEPMRTVSRQRLRLVEQAEQWLISLGSAKWTIDRRTGLLSKGTVADTTIVRGGPHLMMLPLLSGPCNTEHQKSIPVYNDVCSDWRRRSAEITKTREEIVVRVKGCYKEADGEFTYHFRADGYVKIDYQFTALVDVKPRQIGIVMDLDKALTTLNWNRQAQWSVYPGDHIGRPEGIAHAAGEGKPGSSWFRDDHEMGCNDFRSSKRNIVTAALCADSGTGLQASGHGRQTVRAFLTGGGAHMLIADYSTGGADIFIDTHYAGERRRIQKGDRVEGSCLLRMLYTR